MEGFHCLGFGFCLSLIILIVSLCVAVFSFTRLQGSLTQLRTEGQRSAGCIIFCSFTQKNPIRHMWKGLLKHWSHAGLGQNVDNLPSGEHCQADKKPAHACTHTHIWSHACAHACANTRIHTRDIRSKLSLRVDITGLEKQCMEFLPQGWKYSVAVTLGESLWIDMLWD